MQLLSSDGSGLTLDLGLTGFNVSNHFGFGGFGFNGFVKNHSVQVKWRP